MNLFKFITIVFLLIFFTSSESKSFQFDIDSKLNRNKNQSKYIYIKSLEDFQKVDTVTYLFGDNLMDVSIVEEFFKFSNLIGLKNGAVFIPSYSKYSLKLNGKILEQPDKITVLAESNCTFPSRKPPYLVFENKIQNKCYFFYIENKSNFITTLSKLYKHINNDKGLTKYQLKKDITDTLDSLSKEFPLFKGAGNQIKYLLYDIVNEIYDKM